MDLIGGIIGVVCIFALVVLSTTRVRCIKNRRFPCKLNNIKNKEKKDVKFNRRSRD